MAELVTIEGQQFKKRNPFGVYLLGLITVGIYTLVWYYKINDEARRYLRDDAIKPAYSVLAFIPGVILLYIPPLVSVFRSGERVKRMQTRAGVQSGTVSAALTLLLLFVFGVWVIYLQSGLNQTWEAAAATQTPSSA